MEPSKISKLIIGAKNVYAHKSLVKFEAVDLESDRNYKTAEERFLAFRSQLSEMITNAEQFRAKLKESAGLASKLAHNFMRMSQGDVGEGEPEEAWMTTAKRQSEVLKTTTADSALVVEQVLYIDMDQFLLSDLKAQLESYSDINKLVKERYELKVELQHYSDKVQELNFNPKATEEKKVRNAEKYATAYNKLREQTDALMRRFAEAELRRRRVLEEDLPRLMDLHRSTYEAMAANALKAAQGITLAPARSRSSLTTGKGLSTSSFGAGGSVYLSNAAHVPSSHVQGSPSDNAAVPPGGRMSEIPLVDEPRASSRSASCTSLPVAQDSSRSLSPPVAASYNRNASLPAPASAGLQGAGGALGASAHSMASTLSTDYDTNLASLKGLPLAASVPGLPLSQVGGTTFGVPNNGTVATSPERDADGQENPADPGSAGDAPPMLAQSDSEELPPGFIRVRALFDFEAAQPGDLNFKAGDIIITESAQWGMDGWVNGICNGQTGQFPSNYTERID